MFQANDKLGLIYDAKEAINKRSDIEEAFDSFVDSDYRELQEWYVLYKKYLPEEAKIAFEKILNTMTPFKYYKISGYIDDNFKYDEESLENLKEIILGEKENEEM